jgi:hypothetical protein
VALIALLVGVVVMIGSVVAGTIPAILASAAVAGASILLALRLCETDGCRVLGALAWAFKWSVVIGGIIAVATLNAGSGLIVAIFGGVTSALIWQLIDRRCRIPRLLGQP